MPTQKIRVGAVSYLNTKPLIHGLEQGLGSDRIELSVDVPAVLAGRMQQGEIDVALLPVIELARMPDLEIVERIPLEVPPTDTSRDYLRAKRDRMGHLI